MATKIRPTNHDSWLVHFHVGVRGTPLTVYLMDDGTYEVWYGKVTLTKLAKDDAARIFGRIMFSSTRIRL